MNTATDYKKLPKVLRTGEVGDTHFYLLPYEEKILVGWSEQLKKKFTLFKNKDDKWAFYDKPTKQVTAVEQWNGDQPIIYGYPVPVKLKHKLAVQFEHPLTFTVWQDGKEQHLTSQQAIITITDAVMKKLTEAAAGRQGSSMYRITYKQGTTDDGKAITYPEAIVWAKQG